jgi:hypothetical protein
MMVLTIEIKSPITIPMSPNGKPKRQIKPHMFAEPHGPKLPIVSKKMRQATKTAKLTENTGLTNL